MQTGIATISAIVSIANGWLRYFPHPRDFADPDADLRYEIAMSTFEPDAALRLLEAGALPVVIGGDHSVNIPCIEAFAGQGPMHILHIDAHLDFVDERHGGDHRETESAEILHCRWLHGGVGKRGLPGASSSGQTITFLPSCHWKVTILCATWKPSGSTLNPP